MLADDDGIVIAPRAQLEACLERAAEIEHVEAAVLAGIQRGASLIEMTNLAEHVARLRRGREQRAGDHAAELNSNATSPSMNDCAVALEDDAGDAGRAVGAQLERARRERERGPVVAAGADLDGEHLRAVAGAARQAAASKPYSVTTTIEPPALRVAALATAGTFVSAPRRRPR